MGQRLNLPTDRVRVVFNGINLEGYDGGEWSVVSSQLQQTTDNGQRTIPVLGYFARMCREKGLDRLVEAFIFLKRRERTKNLKFRVGGGCGPADEPFVNSLRERLKINGVLHDVEFHPNIDRAAKLDFLRSLTVFSVPALYGEAFGLYVVEALAAGVPVVQPRAASFPELIEGTGGGVLYEPGDVRALADAVKSLLADPEKLRALGEAGRKVVLQDFSAERMAEQVVNVFRGLSSQRPALKEAENAFQFANPKSPI